MNRRAFVRYATTLGVSGVAATAPAWGLDPRAARRAWRADLILRGATVYDGTGAAPVEADVAVRADRIEALGPDLDAAGATVIDLRGLALAPGFIDVHSHTDLVLLVNPRAESKIRQGVTTEVVGQDGGSIGPWTDEEFESVRDRYRSGYDADIDFRDLAGFFRRLRREPPSVNVASMVGAGTVRQFVVGADNRRATEHELASMVSAIRDGLRAGACGVSSGLEYVPGAFADLDELVGLAAPLRGTGLPYATHMRNEDDQLLAAIEEAINVGRLAGVPVQVSHLKAQGRRNWWKAQAALEVIERARKDGVDVAYDRYPYVAYSTGLSSLYPVWSRDGGTNDFLARLDDPALHPRLEAAVREKIGKLGSWDAVQITSTASDSLAWARGRRLGELAAERSEDPYALLESLIRSDRSRSGMVGFGMSEENTARFLAHPLGMICSDAGARAPYGPLGTGTPHPRTYGAFPRVLGHYCRDQRLMPLTTGIHKMTAMPADRLKLADRGRIVPGGAADLVAFDPDSVSDRATFREPHQYPTGIVHVMVNGRFVIRDGDHTGATPGRVLTPAV